MRIATFSDGRHTSAIPLRAGASRQSSNWITVLIGRNGAKKSLLLRLLLEGALKHASFATGTRHPVHPDIGLQPPSTSISAAIAIAGTPFDRFPRQTRYQRPLQSTRYDAHDAYFYLGMKAANGTMGSSQGVRTLASLLFQILASAKHLAGSIDRVFDFLGYRHEVRVVVRRHSSINFSRGERSGSQAAKPGELSSKKLHHALVRASGAEDDPELVGWADDILEDPVALHNLGRRLADLPMPLSVGFVGTAVAFDDTAWDAYDLLMLAKAGIVVSAHLCFQKRGAAEWLLDSELSSGQWHLISSMLGLALTLQPDALVLIDEPENSLHPEWQRAYATLLSDVIGGTAGCHVFIATHSPLIASGVKPGTGDVVRMEAGEDTALDVELCLVEPTYGWDASDVYRQVFGMETARAASFVEAADEALELIATGDRSSRRLKTLAKQFGTIVDTLPRQDPMRTVLGAIINVASDPAGES